MFEKEAEEKSVVYVDKLAKERHFEKGTSYTVGLEEGYNDGFKDGAEFGYNKANEWHYVKDGDLPSKTTLVLIKACGCFILGWLDDNDVWHNDSDNGARIPKENIYAWKEIVLPELKESE